MGGNSAIRRSDFTQAQIEAGFASANGKSTQPLSNGRPATPASASQAQKDAAMVDHAVYLSKASTQAYNAKYKANKQPATRAAIQRISEGLSGDGLETILAGKTSEVIVEGLAFDKDAAHDAGEITYVVDDPLGVDAEMLVVDSVSVRGKPDTPFERNISSAWEHQPHAAYSGLSSERTETTYQDQQNFPISGEKKELRKYSPFTISLIPPKEITDLNKTTSTNKDPYSWSGLGKLATKIEDTMTMPAEDRRYFSSAWSGDEARLGERAKAASKLETALSELSVLSYEGSLSAQTEHHISGRSLTNVTPLLSVANIADIYHQLIEMFRTPPLVLLINPQSMNVTYSKIQAHQERTRYGYIFQAWGEQLPVINFAGRIGAYVSTESDSGRRQFMSVEKTTHPSGVQESSRHMSPAYQNLMNLMKLYKNNGYIRDTVGASQANHLIGAVEIAYDGVRYIGHFDKLEYTFEEQGNLGGVSFSFDFTATEIRRDDSERMRYVTKMRNPNEGARFGDGGMDSTYSTMEQYRNERGDKENSWYVGSNDFADEDPNTPGNQNSVTASWNDQVKMPSRDNRGEAGWGTGGFQRSTPPASPPELSDFEGYNDPDDE